MAVGVVNTSNLSNLKSDHFQGRVMNLIYYNNELLKSFAEAGINPSPMRNDSSYTWNPITAGHTVTAANNFYSEGDTIPAPQKLTYGKLTVDPLYAWLYVQVDRRVEDNINNGVYNAHRDKSFDPIGAEFDNGLAALKDLFNLSFMGGTYGLELSIDANSAYAGQARGSASWHESVETAVSGALTSDFFSDTIETLRDDPIGGLKNLGQARWFMPENQWTNYSKLTGGVPGTIFYNPKDKMFHRSDAAKIIQGIPVITFPEMTNTVILLADLNPTFWAMPMWRPFDVWKHNKSGDRRTYLLSMGMNLINKNPKVMAKGTGITA